MEIKKLFDDEAVMVLDKPAGVVVNKAQTVPGETIQDWFVDNYGEILEMYRDDDVFMKRLGMVHRLDKETSGCLLWALEPKVLKDLMAQFKNREIEKEYIALLHGELRPAKGTMRLPITRDLDNRHKRTVSFEGKQAQTSWQVVKRFAGEDYKYSLVRVRPKTGRTHQIRVHMAHLGHPVVADSLYLNDKRYKNDSKKLDRQFLHAYKIGFRHPLSNEQIVVESKLSEKLKSFVDKLELVEEVEVGYE